MGVAGRLTSPATGNGDSGIPIAPGGVARDAVTGLFDTGVNPADTKNKIRHSADVVYDSNSLLKDVRSGGANEQGRVVFVNSDATGADTFTLGFECDLDQIPGYVKGTLDVDGVFTTSALNDDDSAATIQTAVRAALPGTDLTVIEGPGPDFYIIFDRNFWPRRYPRVIFTGTGCTATITTPSQVDQDARGTVLTAARDGEQNLLGESAKVSNSDTILRPTIGTITVTGGTDAVHTMAFSAGTDEGTFGLRYREAEGGLLAFNVDGPVLQAAVDELFVRAHAGKYADSSPTVELATPLSLEVQFVDWDTTDSAILTYDKTGAQAAQPSDSLLFATLTAPSTAAEREAIIKTWIRTIDDFASETVTFTVTEVTEDQEYDVVFTNTYGITAGEFALAVTGSTNEDVSPDANQAFSADAGWKFTYENGLLAGTPVALNQGVVIYDDNLADGGVAEPATISLTTAGVRGSASAAYTENGSGDSVLAAAVHDGTGDSYGFVGDAATPVVITGLVPGAYHMVLRTVEDGRVSKADSKAFTVTST